MKLECVKDRLKEAVYLAERVAGKNLALPILSAVTLTVEKNKIIVRATNLDIGLEVEVPAKVEQTGVVALNASVLSNFLGNLYKEEKVSLELVEENIHVSTPRSSTLIKSYPVEDFPLIPQVAGGYEFKIDSKKLINGFRSVAYAAALSDIKPEIASVYLYNDDGFLYFVATDSFRLAEKKVSLDVSEPFSLIIPHRNVGEIIRIFEAKDGEVMVRANRNQVSFFADGVHFTTRVIDGIYPDYRQIMPKETTTEIILDKEDLIQLLKLSSVFSDKFSQIDLVVNPDDQVVEINARNQDVGENTASLKAKVTGEPISMSFNGRYVLDCFSAIPADQISLSFKEKNRPLQIKGTTDTSFTYIVMPINR